MRIYDSLFPWSVIPSDTGRKEVSKAGNEVGTGYTAGRATSAHAEQALCYTESHDRNLDKNGHESKQCHRQ